MNYYDLLYLIPPATVLLFAIWFFYPSLAGKGDENIARGVCLVRPLHCLDTRLRRTDRKDGHGVIKMGTWINRHLSPFLQKKTSLFCWPTRVSGRERQP